MSELSKHRRVWKPAIQQTGKSALRLGCEISGLEIFDLWCGWVRVEPEKLDLPFPKRCRGSLAIAVQNLAAIGAVSESNDILNQGDSFAISRFHEFILRRRMGSLLFLKFARFEERTLSIGFGIKRASQREVGLPEFRTLQPALNRCKPAR